jgi:hypothetical protein
VRRTSRITPLAVAVVLASTMIAAVTGSAVAASTEQGGGGGGGGGMSTANLRDVASMADVQPTKPTAGEHNQLNRPVLPSKPTTGHRPALPAGGGAAVNGTPTSTFAVMQNFEGIAEGASCFCEPSDVNAAASPTEIAEVVNTFLQVTDKDGTILCNGGVALNRFFNTSDALSDPRIQYDNLFDRFTMTVTVIPASSSATPALWVVASDTGDVCGRWSGGRLTFQGGSFPSGTLIDYPMLGQDTDAVLLSTANVRPNGSVTFSVFGLPKSKLYIGAHVDFVVSLTDALAAPVTNGGTPMVSTFPFSYFVTAAPGVGYVLYRMTNAGTLSERLTKQATISSPFTAPTRRINQPRTATTLDPLDGRIQWSPVTDGFSIWFAHDVSLSGFPTVQYGAIDIASNTVTVAFAFHSGTSDDFNPSIGIGLAPGGGTYVFLNWAYTDTVNGVGTSDVVDWVLPFGGVPNLIASGQVHFIGTSTEQTRFGDYSSVVTDPSVPGGSCAVIAQQYFDLGLWHTRVARVGSC